MKSLEDNRHVAGADPILDEALSKENEVREYLTQGINENSNLQSTLVKLRELTGVA